VPIDLASDESAWVPESKDESVLNEGCQDDLGNAGLESVRSRCECPEDIDDDDRVGLVAAFREGYCSDLHVQDVVPRPPNGVELSCPAEAGSLARILAHAAGQSRRPMAQPAGSAAASCWSHAVRIALPPCNDTSPLFGLFDQLHDKEVVAQAIDPVRAGANVKDESAFWGHGA
jgi:hypothetical protein